MSDHSKYIVFGSELSYFTRKLEAAMIFCGADFELRAKEPSNRSEIEGRAGTHQVPVLQTPENWMIADTTPLLQLLDSRFPDRRMFPEGPLGVQVQILEEYFDEWIARTMVHFRWHYTDSARFASDRMSGGNAEAAERVLSWGPRACRATGTESEHQQREAEAEYVRILGAMETQLGETPFMLGHRPTALDCILLGGLRAHTNMDPDPKLVTASYPRVIAWCEEAADRWAGDGALDPFPAATPFASFVVEEMAATYKPYVLGNRDAQAAGAKAFHVEIYGEDVSFLSRPYPEQSRRMIVKRIQSLPAADRTVVETWLESVNLLVPFANL